MFDGAASGSRPGLFDEACSCERPEVVGDVADWHSEPIRDLFGAGFPDAEREHDSQAGDVSERVEGVGELL